MNSMRQIEDGLRNQERAPTHGWVPTDTIPLSDLLVMLDQEDETTQYMLMVKIDLT